MYKEGINLNTITVAKLKTLPGIGDNLARSIILHRELKSEFVNPDEFKEIVPQNVYAAITENFNIYTVSPYIWKTRITTEKIHLYGTEFCITALGEESFALRLGKKIYLLNFPVEDGKRRVIENLIGAIGVVAGLKRIFGWKAAIKVMILPTLPDLDALDRFLSFYDVEKVMGIFSDDIIVSSTASHSNISAMQGSGKFKVLAPYDGLTDGDLEIKMLYPSSLVNSRGSALLVRFGSVSILFMFNMTLDEQHDLMRQTASSAIRQVSMIYSCGFEPLAVLVRFCGNPRVMNFLKEKEIICDGNLWYVRKKR